MIYPLIKTEAMECDEMTKTVKRATAAIKKFGDVMRAFFEKVREGTVTQKRFYEATKDFYK